MKRKSNKLFIIVTSLLIIGLAYFGLRLYIDKVEEEAKLQAQKENILEGVQLEPHLVEVDYAKKIADGSPLVFGGSHTPPTEHSGIWDELSKTGITMIRKDLYVEFTLPRTISIEDYKKNRNNVQDTSTWDQKTITDVKTALQEAKKRNIKVMGIMGYAPKWLTYNGSPHGVPKDWEVYSDIVKKTYSLYRDELDYVEIWNEPDHRIFLVTEGSDLSKEEAYANIYITASNAIKEVDNEKNDGKYVKIGAGVESNPRVSHITEYLLDQEDVNIIPDFLSFHTYDEFIPSLNIYKELAKKINNKPIFITEWNNESRDKFAKEYKTGDKAFTFTSSRLMDYIKNEVAGANYFAILPINTSNRGTDENTMGFYRWENNSPNFLPQAHSWKILSKSLGLGNGPSKIMDLNYDQELFNSLGFINSENIKGVALLNQADTSQIVEFDLKNTGIKRRAKVEIFIASPKENGGRIFANRRVYPENDTLKFRYVVPENSVIGFKFSEDHEWYDFFEFQN